MKKPKLAVLIASVLIAEGSGALSAILSKTGKKTYKKLKKPSFSPPPWIFPVIWPALFLSMGISAYRIFINGENDKDTKKALRLYFFQLFLNFIWPIIFFRFDLFKLAFIEIMLLFISILMTTFEFYKHDKAAAYLMLPYIIWVAFASVLNDSIAKLN